MQIDCVYNSMRKADVTTYGEATAQEMCFAFFVYYPSTHVFDECIALGPGVYCPTYKSEFQEQIGNCSIETFLYIQLPTIVSQVTANCEASACSEECLDVILSARKNPCLYEDVAVVTEPLVLEYGTDEMGTAMRLLHSCDREIYASEDVNDTPKDDDDKYAEVDGMACPFTEEGSRTENPQQPGDGGARAPGLSFVLVAAALVLSTFFKVKNL